MEPHNRRTLGPGQPASILCGQGLALAGAVLAARRETKCEEEQDDVEQADHGWAGPGACGQQAIRSQLPSIRITKDGLGPTQDTVPSQVPAAAPHQPFCSPGARPQGEEAFIHPIVHSTRSPWPDVGEAARMRHKQSLPSPSSQSDREVPK